MILPLHGVCYRTPFSQACKMIILGMTSSRTCSCFFKTHCPWKRNGERLNKRRRWCSNGLSLCNRIKLLKVSDKNAWDAAACWHDPIICHCCRFGSCTFMLPLSCSWSQDGTTSWLRDMEHYHAGSSRSKMVNWGREEMHSSNNI